MTRPSPTDQYILALPNELLLQIAADLRLCTLNALVQTCTRLYRALGQQVYARGVREERCALKAGRQTSIAAAAGRLGNIQAVRYLMHHRPLSDSKQGQEYWADCLREAAANGHEALVRFLLGAGVNSDNTPDLLGGTKPIVVAAENNHIRVVEMLLDARGSNEAPTDLRHCPLYSAAIRAHQPNMALIRLLLDRIKYPSSDLAAILYAVAATGRTELAEELLDAGADTEGRDADGLTPLCLAVEGGHHETVAMLLRRGANIHNVNEIGATPLCLAVQNRDHATAKMVRLLVEHGADPNERYISSQTPLHVATNLSGGDADIVQTLLDLGADWRVKQDSGVTVLVNAMQTAKDWNPSIQHLIDAGAASYPEHYSPDLLYWAIYHKRGDIVQRLIAHGLDLEALHSNGQQGAVFAALYSGREEMLKLILPHLTDLSWKSPAEGTILPIFRWKSPADGTALTFAACFGSDETVRLLLERVPSSSINATDRMGRTALMHAAGCKGPTTVSSLLERCSDPNACDITGQTALHHAVLSDRLLNATLLLERGLDPCQADHNGTTPQMVAMRRNSPDMINLLFNEAANIEVRDGFNATPLMAACQLGHFEVVKLLLQRQAVIEPPQDECNSRPLIIACQRGDEGILRLLLAYGADPTIPSWLGQTAIGIAAYNGHTTIARILLEHGVPVDTTDKTGRTPLFWATIGGHVSVLPVLQGANVDHLGTDGRTALSHAAESGHNDIILYLLRQGANIDLPDSMGRTPLIWAVLAEKSIAVEVLVEAGANVALADEEGHTPVSYAMRSGKEAIVKLLYQAC